MGDVQDKVIQVPTDLRSNYAVGEEVEVVLKATMGLKAVWIAYALPIAILMVVVLVLLKVGLGEVVAAGSGLGTLALYYFVVWLLRDRLRDTYIFTIRKLNDRSI